MREVVAFCTQKWSLARIFSALTAIFSDMRWLRFFGKSMVISSSLIAEILPIPQLRWKTKLPVSKAMCFSKSAIASWALRHA